MLRVAPVLVVAQGNERQHAAVVSAAAKGLSTEGGKSREENGRDNEVEHAREQEAEDAGGGEAARDIW